MMDTRHLLWIPISMFCGFLSSFVFADLLALPLDLYYLVYFAIIITMFVIYIKRTELDINLWVSRRVVWGILLGLIFSFVEVNNVLSRPETPHFEGAYLVWMIFWRGLVYGTVDGLLLTVFPWIVTWRAFNAEQKTLGKKIAIGFLAWIFIVFTTTAYHFGYADFRTKKVIQADIGNTIMSVPTLLSANPIASPITHAALHIVAVIHSPHTELFLPPHRD